jgi:two-component system, cell cycle sensor histidine kinase and response regulator CckA
MSDPQPVPVTRLTVIVAEDEDVARRLVSRLLESEGYRILEARDGGEALRMAREAGPHLRLVVTDVVMPAMDGWELGRRLALERPDVPVLYLSAYPRSDIFNRGAPDGAIPFLEKPFSSEAFLETVRSLIEGLAVSRPEK